MKIQPGSTSFGSRFAQIAWVVKDIQAAEKFFKEVVVSGTIREKLSKCISNF